MQYEVHFYMLADVSRETFFIKGVLGRYIHLMRPFQHYALRTSHLKSFP